ncbi:DNA sulfur modification protein DndE [Thalassospira lucentensis]|uniref:DNA sulfur modification protein DndE n=1 Tax=Thalassospira lucentensis TaxID=168935 RepID=UPI0003B611F6|nr:DNA sulfur modification protein DndE [Thalassospira lucentensis]RCK27751.1 DNA sulfur modification protein DndE [Thalassospira lucentensis MCCC 1A00383 = DSM 14000]
MHINKFRISPTATGHAKIVAQRAGLTPNLACRMAMLLSFEAGPVTGNSEDYQDGQEFNAYTLFGDFQPIFIDMLKFVEFGLEDVDVNESVLLERLRLHIDRGIRQLSVRIKSPADAAELIAGNV